MVRYEFKRYKTIINKLKHADSWFWCKYTINPYNGCEHDCIYCDARSQRYHLHEEFDDLIYVKEGAAEQLDLRISRARTMAPDVVALGGTCDAYQQAEKEYKVTLSLLEVLLKHGFPVEVSTKSDLVLRDAPLLGRIARKAGWCTVMFTITTLDDEVAALLEGGAPGPAKRLAAMKRIKEAHPQIQVGTNFMPVVPFLEDSPENIDGVIRASKEAGADFVLFGAGMTMRDKQRDYFLEKVARHDTSLVPSFHELYKAQVDRKGTMYPSREWSAKVQAMGNASLERHGMANRMKRYIPDDHRRLNYIVAEQLLVRSYAMQVRGDPGFKQYLLAGKETNDLPRAIEELARDGGLAQIPHYTKAIAAEAEQVITAHAGEGRKNGLLRFL